MHTRALHILVLIALLFTMTSCDDETKISDENNADGTTGASIIDDDSLAVGDNYRYPDTLLAYLPAPSQFINDSPARPRDAQSIIGNKGFVTLGGWGGYIIVGYHKPIINDASNPYGVDFSIFGNAYTGSSEPGIVQVMKDENKNGKADDTWYELQGEDHNNKSCIQHYSVTYYHVNDSLVTWKNNQGQTDTLMRNGYHTQSYYPLSEEYPDYPRDSISYTGTLLPTKSYEESPGHWVNPAFGYGYADNKEVNWSTKLYQADDPETEALEGAGGDAFKLEWAVDSLGQGVRIDTIHFIKVYSAVQFTSPIIGDVSTEIKAIVAVR